MHPLKTILQFVEGGDYAGGCALADRPGAGQLHDHASQARGIKRRRGKLRMFLKKKG